VLDLAAAGARDAARANAGLASGYNVVAGQVTYAPVAEATGHGYVALDEALG
jgi:alanine dehydrogenase